MKVSQLIGAELDYWVGMTEGLEVEIKDGICFQNVPDGKRIYSPSTNWAQAGEIIEKENICWHENHGELIVEAGEVERGHINLPLNTPKLIAGMRCYVTSRFGEAVAEK